MEAYLEKALLSSDQSAALDCAVYTSAGIPQIGRVCLEQCYRCYRADPGDGSTRKIHRWFMVEIRCGQRDWLPWVWTTGSRQSGDSALRWKSESSITKRRQSYRRRPRRIEGLRTVGETSSVFASARQGSWQIPPKSIMRTEFFNWILKMIRRRLSQLMNFILKIITFYVYYFGFFAHYRGKLRNPILAIFETYRS